MHRGRFGGNARKRKAKLTDATFSAMIGVALPAESPVATIEQDDTEFVQAVITVDLPAVPRPEAGIGRPALAREFACQEYQFGYATCHHCRNDQAYYIHQAALQDGFTFRCRVCCLEMTVSGKT